MQTLVTWCPANVKTKSKDGISMLDRSFVVRCLARRLSGNSVLPGARVTHLRLELGDLGLRSRQSCREEGNGLKICSKMAQNGRKVAGHGSKSAGA